MLPKKKSVFYKLLVSYILVSAIPVLILGGIFYYFNVTNMKNEVSKANLAKLSQFKDEMDMNLREISNISAHLSANSKMLFDTNSKYEQNLPQIVSQLQAYKENSPLVEEIILYYRGSNILFSSVGLDNYSNFEGQTWKGQDWTNARFFMDINSILAPTFKRIEPQVDVNAIGTSYLAYMFPVPLLSTSPEGTAVYLLKEDEILNRLYDMLGYFNGYVYIFDSDRRILMTNRGKTAETGDSIERQMRTYSGTGVFENDMDDQKYVTMRLISQENNWNYVVAMPAGLFFEEVSAAQTFVLYMITGFVLLGLMFAIFVSLSSYRPIKILLRNIGDLSEYSGDEQSKNELDTIRITIENTLQKNRELIVQMDAQRPLVKAQCLLKILRGKISDYDQLDYMLKCANLKINAGIYFVMLVRCGSEKEYSIYVNRMAALLEELYFTDGKGYGIELVHEKGIAVLVEIDVPEQEVKITQQHIAEDVLSLLDNQINIRTRIGIGNDYKDILQLNASFLESSAALNESFTNISDRLYFFSDMQNSQDEQMCWYPVKEQSLFIQSLKQGDKSMAIEALDEMILKISQEVKSYLMLKCLCFDIVNNVIKTFKHMNIEGLDSDIKLLAEFSYLEDFHEKMRNFALRLCDNIEKWKERKSSELKNNIIQYVNEHFCDSNISLDSIASRFDISVTYLGRFFKEETAVNFSEYITVLRMDESKRQLRTTVKPIKQIVFDVGYLDAASFARKFKSIEGITPGQYREMGISR